MKFPEDAIERELWKYEGFKRKKEERKVKYAVADINTSTVLRESSGGEHGFT